MLTSILFILGFVILIKGANLLVDGSVSIAKKFKVSSIVIGLTIVAFGTSTPEFVVNMVASFKGNSEIAIGNILGSNIANILLILGISSIINPITAKRNTVLKEIPLSLLAIVILGIMANDKMLDRESFSDISRLDGFVLLLFLIIFLYYVFSITKTPGDIALEKEQIKVFSYTKSIMFIILGIIGLAVGGKWIVDGAVNIAQYLGVSQSFIGLTIVAGGTSLPELATSAVAAYKKQSDIAIGNVVGSNIMNIFWIIGFSAIIRPLPFNAKSNIDIAVAIYASVMLFVMMFMGTKRVIDRREGIFLVMSYFIYILYLIISV